MAKQNKRAGIRRRGRPGAVAAVEYDSQASVGYQLRKTWRAMASLLRAQIASENISIGMWYFLRALWVRDGMIQRELTEHVGLMQPTTVAALRSMQRRGLVRTEPDKTDRRSIRIFLTRQGRQLKSKLLPKVAQLNKIALRGVSRDDRDLFLRVLKKIHDNAAAVSSSRSS
jgi:MarR family transcriptional regulator, organic hydroperoxide resistance regulator